MRRVGMLVAAGAAMGLAGAALGQGIDFASATVMNIGSNNRTFVSGSLSPDVFDETLIFSAVDQFRAANTWNNYMVNGTAGAGFRAETSAPTNGMTNLDTRLRVRDSLANVLGDDDDSGVGTFSLVTGTVPGDGILDIDVSHWNDSGYNGTGATTGWYNLNVFETQLVSAGVHGQWWAFTGLTPGGEFVAETIAAMFTGTFSDTDTVIAAWDSSGALIGSDDDGAATGNLSLLTGTVPGDGTVYISVTAYHGSGQGFVDYYTSGNTATGTFELSFIPTPGSLALLGLGGLVAVRRRR